jgi:hypothetical protein
MLTRYFNLSLQNKGETSILVLITRPPNMVYIQHEKRGSRIRLEVVLVLGFLEFQATPKIDFSSDIPSGESAVNG